VPKDSKNEGEIWTIFAAVQAVPEFAVLSSVEEQRLDLEVEFQSFSRLRELPAEPDWLWEGYLVPGSLTMLAGHPFTGKSMLVSGLLKAIEEGSPFLGRSTKQATAVLVSEEDASALRARADVLGVLDLESEYASRGSGVFAVEWPELIAQATGRALRAGHSLLVIDTFPGLAGLGDEQENDAGAIAERLRPLQEAAGYGLAVLFLHHMNAQGQPRGSRAFRGVVDIATRLYRQNNSNAFRLESESRFPTAFPSRVEGTLVQDPGCWFYRTRERGASSDNRGSQAGDVDERLWEVLVEAGTDGLTYDQIDQIAGLSADIAKRRLPSWLNDGRVSRRGRGTRGSPYQWVAVTG
jgi:hypothetical protein